MSNAMLIATEVALGAKVIDRPSGFTGIVTARIEYIGGGLKFEVTGASEDGREGVSAWFEAARLKVIEGGLS